jgi:hypothetical protein
MLNFDDGHGAGGVGSDKKYRAETYRLCSIGSMLDFEMMLCPVLKGYI